MRAPALRGSEAAALALALVAHGGLVAVLMLRPNPAALPVPQRMTVTLSNDVGMTSTSPSTRCSPTSRWGSAGMNTKA